LTHYLLPQDAVNLYSECQGVDNPRIELCASGFSILILLVSCWGVVVEAISRLDADEPDDVNMNIVLIFAVMGLLIDFVSLYLFSNNDSTTEFASSQSAGEGGPPKAGGLNMCTACLHSGADLMRSTTTLILSLLALHGHINNAKADAIASLAVSVTIMVAACYLTKELYYMSMKSANGQDADPEEKHSLTAEADILVTCREIAPDTRPSTKQVI
jgi:Co/Zn/Cd efflux system component